MKIISILIVLFSFISCKEMEKNKLTLLLKEWEGKEIIFPSNSIFTIKGRDTIEYSISRKKYKIVTYVDSLGCTDCKLRLREWKKFIKEVHSLTKDSVSFYFYFYPKNKKELIDIMLRDNFVYPVCLDENDDFNYLNKFPSDIVFQTFLLDRDDKVVAIGNPIHNSNIKDLYLKIIQNKEFQLNNENKNVETIVYIEKTSMFLDEFDWHNEQETIFALKNVGNNLLFIEDVTTSCGCISVYYSRKPVKPGKEIFIRVVYKAEHPEHFNKSISVYCNSQSSPLQLKIVGNAK